MHDTPLISVIMPTANRPAFVKQAIECYLSQDYKNKELLILDDGKYPLEGILRTWVDNAEDVTYVYTGPKRKCIAKKRNILCEMAKGEIIAHFDDDDESAPTRLSYQIQFISDKLKLVGFNSILFYRDEDDTLYRYYSSPNYLLGASLLYTKDLWEQFHFNDLQIVGSDNTFVTEARKYIKALPGEDYLVAHIHPHGSNARPVDDPYYKKLDLDKLPKWFSGSLVKT